MREFTVTIHNEAVIKKLVAKGRKKGEYISKLIEADIRLEQLERRVNEIAKELGK